MEKERRRPETTLSFQAYRCVKISWILTPPAFSMERVGLFSPSRRSHQYFFIFGNHIPVKTQSNEEGDQGRGDYCPRDRFQPIHFAAPSSHFFGWIRVLDDSAFSQSYGVGIAVCADKPLIESTSSLLMPPKPPGSLWTGGYHRRRVKASAKVHVARGVLGTPPKKKKPPAKPAGLHSPCHWR
jgi:hypothetical protein